MRSALVASMLLVGSLPAFAQRLPDATREVELKISAICREAMDRKGAACSTYTEAIAQINAITPKTDAHDGAIFDMEQAKTMRANYLFGQLKGILAQSTNVAAPASSEIERYGRRILQGLSLESAVADVAALGPIRLELPICGFQPQREREAEAKAWVDQVTSSIVTEKACMADAKCMRKRDEPVVCSILEERKALVQEMRDERRNPSGFVNKRVLYELGKDIQAVDERITLAKQSFAKIHKSAFSPAVCKN